MSCVENRRRGQRTQMPKDRGHRSLPKKIDIEVKESANLVDRATKNLSNKMDKEAKEPIDELDRSNVHLAQKIDGNVKETISQIHGGSRNLHHETDKELKTPTNLVEKTSKGFPQKMDKKVKAPTHLADRVSGDFVRKTDNDIIESADSVDGATRDIPQKTDKEAKETTNLVDRSIISHPQKINNGAKKPIKPVDKSCTTPAQKTEKEIKGPSDLVGKAIKGLSQKTDKEVKESTSLIDRSSKSLAQKMDKVAKEAKESTNVIERSTISRAWKTEKGARGPTCLVDRGSKSRHQIMDIKVKETANLIARPTKDLSNEMDKEPKEPKSFIVRTKIDLAHMNKNVKETTTQVHGDKSLHYETDKELKAPTNLIDKTRKGFPQETEKELIDRGSGVFVRKTNEEVVKSDDSVCEATRTLPKKMNKAIEKPTNLEDKSSISDAEKMDRDVKEPFNLAGKSSRSLPQKKDKDAKEPITLLDKSNVSVPQKTNKEVKNATSPVDMSSINLPQKMEKEIIEFFSLVLKSSRSLPWKTDKDLKEVKKPAVLVGKATRNFPQQMLIEDEEPADLVDKSTTVFPQKTHKEVKQLIYVVDRSNRSLAQKTEEVEEPADLDDKSATDLRQKNDKVAEQPTNLEDRSSKCCAKKIDKDVKQPSTKAIDKAIKCFFQKMVKVAREPKCPIDRGSRSLSQRMDIEVKESANLVDRATKNLSNKMDEEAKEPINELARSSVHLAQKMDRKVKETATQVHGGRARLHETYKKVKEPTNLVVETRKDFPRKMNKKVKEPTNIVGRVSRNFVRKTNKEVVDSADSLDGGLSKKINKKAIEHISLIERSNVSHPQKMDKEAKEPTNLVDRSSITLQKTFRDATEPRNLAGRSSRTLHHKSDKEIKEPIGLEDTSGSIFPQKMKKVVCKPVSLGDKNSRSLPQKMDKEAKEPTREPTNSIGRSIINHPPKMDREAKNQLTNQVDRWNKNLHPKRDKDIEESLTVLTKSSKGFPQKTKNEFKEPANLLDRGSIGFSQKTNTEDICTNKMGDKSCATLFRKEDKRLSSKGEKFKQNLSHKPAKEDGEPTMQLDKGNKNLALQKTELEIRGPFSLNINNAASQELNWDHVSNRLMIQPDPKFGKCFSEAKDEDSLYRYEEYSFHLKSKEADTAIQPRLTQKEDGENLNQTKAVEAGSNSSFSQNLLKKDKESTKAKNKDNDNLNQTLNIIKGETPKGTNKGSIGLDKKVDNVNKITKPADKGDNSLSHKPCTKNKEFNKPIDKISNLYRKTDREPHNSADRYMTSNFLSQKSKEEEKGPPEPVDNNRKIFALSLHIEDREQKPESISQTKAITRHTLCRPTSQPVNKDTKYVLQKEKNDAITFSPRLVDKEKVKISFSAPQNDSSQKDDNGVSKTNLSRKQNEINKVKDRGNKSPQSHKKRMPSGNLLSFYLVDKGVEKLCELELKDSESGYSSVDAKNAHTFEPALTNLNNPRPVKELSKNVSVPSEDQKAFETVVNLINNYFFHQKKKTTNILHQKMADEDIAGVEKEHKTAKTLQLTNKENSNDIQNKKHDTKSPKSFSSSKDWNFMAPRSVYGKNHISKLNDKENSSLFKSVHGNNHDISKPYEKQKSNSFRPIEKDWSVVAPQSVYGNNHISKLNEKEKSNPFQPIEKDWSVIAPQSVYGIDYDINSTLNKKEKLNSFRPVDKDQNIVAHQSAYGNNHGVSKLNYKDKFISFWPVDKNMLPAHTVDKEKSTAPQSKTIVVKDKNVSRSLDGEILCSSQFFDTNCKSASPMVTRSSGKSIVLSEVTDRKIKSASLLQSSSKWRELSERTQNPEAESEAAKKKKNDQGFHECEVFRASVDAFESAFAWEKCTKNPGHENFIPIAEFSMSLLPTQYQSLAVMGCITNVAKCTTRLRVSYTSWERPDDYTFAVARGTKIPHTGSGYVYRITPGKGLCPCPDSHGSAESNWWKIYVQTACHVVFNTEEAKATKVDLFYDDEKACVDGRMKTMQGMEVLEKSLLGDRCELVCFTHDSVLVKELQSLMEQSRHSFHALCHEQDNRVIPDLCVAVSHPHAQPKQVTLGKVTSRNKLCGIGRRTFSYNTDTCRGSSGAPIIMPLGAIIIKSPWVAPHSTTTDDGKLNMSGVGDIWLLT
ncbi:hypothetical protein PoB_002299100 [Plakobranchus ocellatus]|uniref:Uncharacterized protein n=1 Tax=Plakobranchus ocellatus TaxID=259542 RepID=A0AAV3ZB41_9GAST|nr:hypothetical protein PoB_002299100 [Plakobranchus ocellatus]